ncbi:hypothetical protein [Paraliomyxa miuraensis]|uniref:hypothetical protein n=1 Tax=Paraliomyxa miuraensis TaxID=376150 RepID=UPI002255DBC5|nr:hypothetical protein [Paraliomyxa miuraensis]MCX4240577.1 hypothetical protein [Paraliomyxa miuraensis]
MTDDLEHAFNGLQWHDAVLLNLSIDRGNPGERDELLVAIEWPDGRRESIRFTDCYGLDVQMNFGMIVQESILDATCTADSPMLSRVRQFWLSYDVSLDDLRYFEIVMNSTASVIRVCARGFEIE